MLRSNRFQLLMGLALAILGNPLNIEAVAQTGLYSGSVPTFPIPAPSTSITTRQTDAVYLGADAAFMCPIGPSQNKKCFWSFCDVAMGRPNATVRNQAFPGTKIGNSIGIADCSNGGFALRHYYSGYYDATTTPPTTPGPFFIDWDNPNNSHSSTRVWPRKALYINGSLFVFAQQTYDLGITNTFIYRVLNPLDDPSIWTIDRVSLFYTPPATGKLAPAFFGTDATFKANDGYIYTYAIINPIGGNFDYNFRVTPFRFPYSALVSASRNADIGLSSGQFMNSSGNWNNATPQPIDPNYPNDPPKYWPAQYWSVQIVVNNSPMDFPAFNSFSVRFNPALPTGYQYQAVFSNDREIDGIQPYVQNNCTYTYTTNNVTQCYPRPPAYKELAPPPPPATSYIHCFQTYAANGPSLYGPFVVPTSLVATLPTALPAGIFPQMIKDNDPKFNKSMVPNYPYDPDIWCAFSREIPEFANSDRDLAFTYTTYSWSGRMGLGNYFLSTTRQTARNAAKIEMP